MSGPLCLLEAMQQEDVKRIVMSGTAAVYGQPEHMPISENSALHPLNPYGVTKLCMERMLADFATAHGLT